LTKGTEKWKYGNSGDWRECFVSYVSVKLFHCSCKRIMPFLWPQTNAYIIAEIQVASVFCEYIVNLNIVVSFYHTMAVKHCLEDGEIERQLKCRVYDELCILGCFEEYYKKARFR
jgi:hypothetical protein